MGIFRVCWCNTTTCVPVCSEIRRAVLCGEHGAPTQVPIISRLLGLLPPPSASLLLLCLPPWASAPPAILLNVPSPSISSLASFFTFALPGTAPFTHSQLTTSPPVSLKQPPGENVHGRPLPHPTAYLLQCPSPLPLSWGQGSPPTLHNQIFKQQQLLLRIKITKHNIHPFKGCSSMFF